MKKTPSIDYTPFDRPEILGFLFYPRPEWEVPKESDHMKTLLIPVSDEHVIGARFHVAGTSAPTILFFHGNGEIVADYDDLGPVYTGMGINFFPVDYRGYGLSSGRPSVSAMMADCHAVFSHAQKWLAENGYTGRRIVMGRSLGSISAIELASSYTERIDGLILESALAYAIPLLELLGIDARRLGITEDRGFNNVDKIRAFDKPTFIIHAQYDHIIPFSDGEALFAASPSKEKKFLMIPGANHNDIFALGMNLYMKGIQEFIATLG